MNKQCQDCKLHTRRKNIVWGRGNPCSKIMIIGEAPGRNEDEQGTPFVGQAGKILYSMLKYVGLTEKDVFITNIIKCRPPRNRDPELDEVKACQKYLYQQMKKQNPILVILLGKVAMEFFSQFTGNMTRGRLKSTSRKHYLYLYHPAYLLYNLLAVDVMVIDLDANRKFIETVKGLPTDGKTLYNIIVGNEV